jgi:HAD superfamily hydrolase (TIGR01509 family)
MNVIIPLAGIGERFQQEGYSLPKPLIPVLGKPILFYVLDNINLGPEDKVFILYNEALKKHNFCETVSARYPNIHLIEMPSTRGAAETVQLGAERILTGGYTYHKQCVLMDCDTFYTTDVLTAIRRNAESARGNAVFYTVNTEKKPIYSYIKLEDGERICEIREKEKISDNANTGIYCFADIHELHQYCKQVIDGDIRFRGEFYTSCVISEMIRLGADFYGIRLDAGRVFSLGTPKQVKEYENRAYGFLFDLDGTLVNTDHIYFDVWKHILSEHNIVLTHEIFDKYIRGNSDSHVQRTLLSHDTTLLTEISYRKDELAVQYMSELSEIGGAVSFLKQVHERGHKIAVVTNCNRKVAEAVLKSVGVTKLVDVLVIGEECEHPKPYSDPYQKAVSFFGLPAERCFVFEDSKTGILSGTGIRPKCIVGIESNYAADELMKSGAQLVFKDYSEPARIFESLFAFSCNTLERLSEYVRETLSLSLRQRAAGEISWTPTKLKGGYISDVLACEALVAEEALACVLKLENQNDSYLSVMANRLGLYEREYYFYEAISKYVNIGIPKFYGLVKTPKFKNVGILLENLNPSCDLALDLNKESVDVSLKVIDACARLHAKFWNVDLENSFPLLKKNSDPLFRPAWSEYVQKQWPEFKEKWSFMMTDAQICRCEEIAANFSEIQAELSDQNLTLVHGDVKSGNIFYHKADRTPYFLDWQYVAIGKGVQDLVFFMIESFDTHVIDKYFQTFKQYYYIKLLEYGVTGYTREEYDADFRNAVKYYPFFVAVWFGTTPEDDLIDKNFPFFFIQKLLHFIELSC